MIRELFPRYQREILTFCNTDFGKEWLGLNRNDKICKVSPDGVHIIKDFQKGRPIIQATFFPRSPFVRKFSLMLESLKIAEEAKFIRQVQKEIYSDPKYFYTHPYVNFSTYTGYPDPDPETNTVDGKVRNSGTTYSTVHNASAGSSAAPSTALMPMYHGFLNPTYYIDRFFFLFNTATIGGGQSISAATLTLTTDGAATNADSDTATIVSSNPASNTDLITDDFDQLGTTSFGGVAFSSITGAGAVNFTLNASGIAAINMTGITKLGCRTAKDISSTQPSGDTAVSWYCAEQTGTGSDPKLVVTYTALPSGGLFFSQV